VAISFLLLYHPQYLLRISPFYGDVFPQKSVPTKLVSMSTNNNYTFIDAQNLHLAIKGQNWEIDYKSFRRYLHDKYGVSKAFLFIGYMKQYDMLYKEWEENGYHLIFKPIKKLPNGSIIGNVDPEIVLHTVIKMPEYDKAIVVSGDGDFHCLIEYLIQVDKLQKLLIPNRYRYSYLLSKFSCFISFMNNLEDKIGK